MRNMIFPIVIISMMFFLPGCSSSPQVVCDEIVSGLEIPEMITSLGSAGEDADEQVLRYTITLVNKNEYEVIVQWVEPVLSNSLIHRVLGEDLKVMVDQVIAPGAFLEVSGQFSIDTEGYTKDQILAWEPFILRMLVASEASLPLPPIRGE